MSFARSPASRLCTCRAAQPVASTSRLVRAQSTSVEQQEDLRDPAEVYEPGLATNAAWKARLPADQLYWWQRQVLAIPTEKAEARREAGAIKQRKRAAHLRQLREHDERKQRRLSEVYHAAATFPMGDRESTLAAIDAEFLDRTPEASPLPVSLDKLLREARKAGKDDDAKGQIAKDKAAARAELFDSLDARRLASPEDVSDSVGSYASYIGRGMHGKRATARAAKVFDALHGTSGLGRPQPPLGRVWASAKEK